MVSSERIASCGSSLVTLLGEDPELWDTVFPESPAHARFVGKLAREFGPKILDVGCATGTLCRHLRRRGFDPVGLDINRRFIRAARAKDPLGAFVVGNMRSFRLRRKFDLIVCLGTTFSYNLTTSEIGKSLQTFHRHLSSDGRLVIDVLNAIAFTGPRPFLRRTRHTFRDRGKRLTATIRHELDLKHQTMTEQVTWRVAGGRDRRDPSEALRLFFPQELAFYVERSGFGDVEMLDDYGMSTSAFTGRRLIIIATPRRTRWP
jgi:SAM-dependent methyltransferase